VVINNPKLEKYLALSYCWGSPGPDILKLTHKTLFDLTQGVLRGDRFSKTHQEAFQLARSLSIQYVWIDALYNLQDDYNDWLTQSTRMGDIYGIAYLTVVAGSSADSRHGFLQDRHSK